MADKKKLAKVYYADVWGRRMEKYSYLNKHDLRKTKWKNLKSNEPYFFLVPKDFALQSEYERFWEIRDILQSYSFGVTTARDHLVVSFTNKEVLQRVRLLSGNMSDDLVKEGLGLKETETWRLSEVRQAIRQQEHEPFIIRYAYRPFDSRWICYESVLIERDRREIMRHIIGKQNMGLNLTRRLRDPIWQHIFVSSLVSDKTMLSSRDNCYFFPLYLYQDESVGATHELPLQKTSQAKRVPNFTPKFLQALKQSIGSKPSPEEIFYYIYAVLYCPTYRKRYEEFLKIDFPRIPLPSSKSFFKKLSDLGKSLVELHLLKHPSLADTKAGFPKGGSNIVEKVIYDELSRKVFVNKDQYFDGVVRRVWDYRIGAYQVMEKYLKDRKKRKLTLDDINHYMTMAKAIESTMGLQQKIDDVYGKYKSSVSP